MKKAFLIIYFFSCIAKGQQNLVLNPSFEDTISHCPQKFTSNCCPGGADRIMMSKYWSGPDTVQFAWNPPYSSKPNGACCVPQFLNSCGSSAWGVPGTYQPAKTGQAIAGLATYMFTSFTWTTSQTIVGRREYLKGRLNTPLILGKEYCGTFYFNLYNYSQYAADKIGMFVSNTSSLDTAKCYNPMTFFTPQIQYSGGVMMDTLNWIKVENSFIASGGENYLVIGNFNSDANTGKVLTNFPSTNGPGAFYMIDDVSIIPTDLVADAGPDKNIFFGDSAYIGKPNEVGINCIWTTGTTTLGSGTGIWVKPTVTTTYIVHQTICGNTKTDTVTVIVDYVGIKENNFSTLTFNISPNPNNGVFKSEFSNFIAGYEYKIAVKDMLGRELRSISLNSKTSTIDLSELDNGVYFIQLKDHFNRIAQKRVILSK